jgi:deoxyribodipyrimidine photo-lyase
MQGQGMADDRPIILWFRRDLRLADHPALVAAAESGRPVIPLFILDEVVEAHGAAPKWRLGLGVAHFAERLEALGSRLILRRGRALEVLRQVVAETGAGAVYWSRLYDPEAVARDTGVKSGLKEQGIEARSFPGHLLFDPWTVQTGQGGFYRVYTPFWKALRNRDPGAPLPAPARLRAPGRWPETDALADWRMGAAMRRGAGVVARHLRVGEAAAQERLAAFLDGPVKDYATAREFPAESATSRLSENLTCGEIGPRLIWQAAQRPLQEGGRGAETFLKELVWREFAYHLVHHSPQITTRNWRAGWERFPWSMDEGTPEVLAWKQGRTGIEFVDAAMREMYVTGTMHNRARMIAASFLTKHLMVHWRIGQRWFEDCLVDWDPASNAMGWQWVAGCGPDAAPYFRIFNPDTQAGNFDRQGAYRDAWIAEGRRHPAETALSYFRAVPESWGLSPGDPYPAPVVDLAQGRTRALSAYENRGF